ncbi:MAG: branched-chain amino acid ABC transporter permease [Rhodobacteraceae bacterium]|jgi:branched-chain amino acid transport system permease protein|nr:branched-chain amino acid ABC transporter permease [Paracoccaceae bacterium]
MSRAGLRTPTLFILVAGLIAITGFAQSWNVALTIVNMGLVSAIVALGLNMQWGYAGLFNIGVMGFLAVGGLTVVLVAMPPVTEAWAAGGAAALAGLAIGVAALVGAVLLRRRLPPGPLRGAGTAAILLAGYVLGRAVFIPGADAIERVNPAGTGFLGGFGLPVILAWPLAGALAAGAAWVIARIALGLRADYLAIATLGIAEIIIAILKHEDWLTRGVKNVVGIPRPVPFEVELLRDPAFVARMQGWGLDPVSAASILVKLAYAALFVVVLALLMWMAEKALNSPWGRMMRAIRDNEVAAEAMGKDVTRRHLQIFVLGAAVMGIAGAMMTTLDGQLTPGSYQPLRFTFLVWVMVIVGGSGSNWGAVLGGFLIWWLWVMVEPIGLWLLGVLTTPLPEGSALKAHLLGSAQHMRLITMGLILLLVLRFAPRGLIPER